MANTIFEMVNGIENELSSEVIVYTKLKGKDPNNPDNVFAYYSSRNLEEVLEKVESIHGKGSSVSLRIFYKNHSSKKPNPEPVRDPSITEKDLDWNPNCVVFAGEYSNEEECIKKARFGVKRYFAKLGKKEEPIIFTSKVIPPEDMVIRIYGEYVGPLISAFISKNKKLQSKLRKDFATFSHGTSFYEDAHSLYNMIERNQGKIPKRIYLDMRIRWIALKNAVEKGEFELAAILRDQLIALRKKNMTL